MKKSYFVLMIVFISISLNEAHRCALRAAPSNGNKRCITRNGKFMCKFSCNSGYHLQGLRQATCNQLGIWNRHFPLCLNNSRCWTYLSRPVNGEVQCTNGFQKGSQCSYQCNEGYKMKGSSKCYCQDNGYWSSKPPVCQPRQLFCDALPKQPENGYRSCTHGRRLGSFCYFQCAGSFSQTGNSISICSLTRFGPKWSSPPPKCNEQIPTTCSSYPQPLNNGEVDCLDGNAVNSVCYYECHEGFVLVGSRSTRCHYKQKGRVAYWNMMTPFCSKIMPYSACGSLPPRPRNGELSCTDKNMIGSRCYFECHEDFSMVGPVYTTCYYNQTENAALWSDISPTCEIMKEDQVEISLCPEIENLNDGVLFCPNANEINSQCTFTCNNGYQLYPSDHRASKCTYEGFWNITEPCCAVTRSCDEDHKADVIIMMDSSTSFGENNWKLVKTFVHDFIDSFSDAKEATRCGVFRFSNVVDTDSQILLRDWVDDKPGLLRAFDKIPSNLTKGASLEQALLHLNKVILNQENGDRPSVKNTVLLFTNAIPSVDLSLTANKILEQKNSKIYIVRINMGLLNKPAEIRELAKITSCYGHIIQPEYDLSGVEKTLSRIKLCRTSCNVYSAVFSEDDTNDIPCYPFDHDSEI